MDNIDNQQKQGYNILNSSSIKSYILLLSILFLLIVLLLIIIFLISQHFFQTKPLKSTNSIKSASLTTTPTPFVSDQNGVTIAEAFGINIMVDDMQTFDARIYGMKVVGDKIYVGYASTPEKPGQYIEVFNKNPKDSLITAIKKQVMNGYSVTNCPISTVTDSSSNPSKWQTAAIHYATEQYKSYSSGQQYIGDIKCPTQYTPNETVSYFVMYPSNPSIFAFISLGGNGSGNIPLYNNIPWPETITFGVQPISNISASPTPTPDQGSLPVLSPTTVQQNGVGYFSDSTIKFNYLLADPSNNGAPFEAMTSNNRICINDKGLDCNGATFIELFKKNATDTIQQAIQKTILAGYNLSDCPIVPFPPPTPTPPKPTPTPTSGPTIPTYTYTPTPTPSPFVPQGWASASINYAQLKGYEGDAAPNNFDSTKCPETFTSEGGGPIYFEVDPNHPSFLIFLVVGNGLIESDSTGKSLWFQTIQFVN